MVAHCNKATLPRTPNMGWPSGFHRSLCFASSRDASAMSAITGARHLYAVSSGAASLRYSLSKQSYFCAAASTAVRLCAAVSKQRALFTPRRFLKLHTPLNNDRLCPKRAAAQHTPTTTWLFCLLHQKAQTSGFCAHSSSPGERMQGSYDADDVLSSQSAAIRPVEVRNKPH